MKSLYSVILGLGIILLIVAAVGPYALRFLHQQTGADLFGWFMSLMEIRIWLFLISTCLLVFGVVFRLKRGSN
jgi:hypothetical protein